MSGKKHEKRGNEGNNITCFNALLGRPEELGETAASSASERRSTSEGERSRRDQSDANY